MTAPVHRLAWPAEWQRARAIWVGYPHAADLWGAELAAAQNECLDLVVALAAGDPVVLVVPTAAHAAELRPDLRGLQVRLHPTPTGDIWLRDTAPVFVQDGAGNAVAACFRFNGWGHKFLLPDDRDLNLRLANACAAAGEAQLRLFDFVLEGGAVDGDGAGTVLTTRTCLLNPNRGRTWAAPALTERQVEAYLAASLGARRVIWLDGCLRNDHTDGHVDTLARFVAPGEVVCMLPNERSCPNAAMLEALHAQLCAARDASGRRLKVHSIPSPGAVYGADGSLLPASYLNFVIGRRSVVVPTYNVGADAAAVAALGRCFAGRKVLGRSALALLSGGGAFHCMTQQQPARGCP